MTDPVREPGTAFDAAVEKVAAGAIGVRDAARSLVDRLDDSELLWLLDGDLPQRRGLAQMARRYNASPIEAGRIDRLGIPGIRFTDGPRGVVMGSATAFPVAVARAATWDPALEREVGEVIGREARALGANFFAGVCVNLAPAPGWGRSQESYGEDPVLIGAMGSALVEGVHPWVMSCVKHYALNSMEEARFVVDVQVDEDVLHEVYLPHFRQVVESGADAVMSAYNKVNGVHAGENPYLLTDILREQWGFDGFTMSDFVWGIRDPLRSLEAGLDVEMPLRQQRSRSLPQALEQGRLSRETAQVSAVRLIAAQIRLALRASPTPPLDVVACAEHRALTRVVAGRATVLLRNELDGRPLLPLAVDEVARVAVLGRLADQANLGDHGSSRVRPPAVVTVLDGLRERFDVAFDGSGDLAAARHLAADADVAVLVVGLDHRDEGEAMVALDADAVGVFGGLTRWRPLGAAFATLAGLVGKRSNMSGGDRRDLRLHPDDVELIRATASVNKRTVVIVIGGGTIVMDPWDREVAAVLMAWYPGMTGGLAIADVLVGDVEPAGRLPMAIPQRAQDLPQVDWRARTVRYGRWWGQRKLDRDGVSAAYPLGFGLGYASFVISDPVIGEVDGERFAVEVSVSNTGSRPGRHVVQVYAAQPDGGRVLVGFASVEVEVGACDRVVVECTSRPLQTWNGVGFDPPTRASLEVAGYCGDPASVGFSMPGSSDPDPLVRD